MFWTYEMMDALRGPRHAVLRTLYSRAHRIGSDGTSCLLRGLREKLSLDLFLILMIVRAKPLSQWKGLAPAQSALGAMNTLFLARRGVQGPLQVIEGPMGIDHLLRMKINIDWDKQGYEGVVESTIKKYNSMIHTQSAVHCMVELARQNKVDPDKVVSIEAQVFQLAFDFAGGGLYGTDNVIRIKEQADHSLLYLLAVALLDRDVMPAQFKPDRIIKPDVQDLLKKISVRPNHEYTQQYPKKMPAKIIVRLQDGKVIEHEVQDYPGLASHPFTWEDAVQKFDTLVRSRSMRGYPPRSRMPHVRWKTSRSGT
jgi:2-methylcitrate dehydratase